MTAVAAAPDVSQSAGSQETIADRIAAFATDLGHDDVPDEVLRQAKVLILDAVGVGLASSTFDFAHRARCAVRTLSGGSGKSSVIGDEERLPLRDSMHLNGLLIHGLDYDDTHPDGVVHATASAFPTAFGVTEATGLSGRELLTAYVLAVEVDARLGMAAKGAFHQVGFHPTGLVGAFGAAVAAGRLRGLSAPAIATAQGFVGSQAAGSLEFLADGSWTKRSHPGWAAVCGVTATAFAEHGFVSPPEVYEGRFGLYGSHLGDDYPVDLEACTDGLGERWETLRVAVKPHPACHFTHAFIDAALALRAEHGLQPDEIDEVVCHIASGMVATVCEPQAKKLQPGSTYDAAFSLQHVVAASLVHGRFELAQLEADVREDPRVRRLTQDVSYSLDPESGFPETYDGEVEVRTRDGRVLRHREPVNRGSVDRPLTQEEIEAKFFDNAAHAMTESQARQVRDHLLGLDSLEDVGALGRALGRSASAASSGDRVHSVEGTKPREG